MQILNHRQIQQKINRLAIEIAEHNCEEEEIILAGINNNGIVFAELLMKCLLEMTNIDIVVTRIKLNPANPMQEEIYIEMPESQLKNKVVNLIDDVANTGRTLFYACRPILDTLPKKLEVAVLVDRKHKSFPISVDYVGLSLATTLKENIDVKIKNVESFAVFLN